MKDYGNNRNRNVIYLQGYLRALAVMNTHIDHNKTYTLDVLKKVNHNIQDTLRAHWGVKHWVFEAQVIDVDWKAHLSASVRPFFTEVIHQAISMADPVSPEKTIAQFEQFYFRDQYVVDHLTGILEKIVGSEAQLMQIEVNWNVADQPYEGFYECYAVDFVFDLGKFYLYLHLGNCD